MVVLAFRLGLCTLSRLYWELLWAERYTRILHNLQEISIGDEGWVLALPIKDFFRLYYCFSHFTILVCLFICFVYTPSFPQWERKMAYTDLLRLSVCDWPKVVPQASVAEYLWISLLAYLLFWLYCSSGSSRGSVSKYLEDLNCSFWPSNCTVLGLALVFWGLMEVSSRFPLSLRQTPGGLSRILLFSPFWSFFWPCRKEAAKGVPGQNTLHWPEGLRPVVTVNILYRLCSKNCTLKSFVL